MSKHCTVPSKFLKISGSKQVPVYVLCVSIRHFIGFHDRSYAGLCVCKAWKNVKLVQSMYATGNNCVSVVDGYSE